MLESMRLWGTDCVGVTSTNEVHYSLRGIVHSVVVAPVLSSSTLVFGTLRSQTSASVRTLEALSVLYEVLWSQHQQLETITHHSL